MDVRLGSNVLSLFLGNPMTGASNVPRHFHYALNCRSLAELEQWQAYLRAKGVAQFSGRMPRAGGGKRLQQIERLSLTPQHSLHMVRVAGQAYLLVLSPAGCTVVGSSTWTDPNADPPGFRAPEPFNNA